MRAAICNFRRRVAPRERELHTVHARSTLSLLVDPRRRANDLLTHRTVHQAPPRLIAARQGRPPGIIQQTIISSSFFLSFLTFPHLSRPNVNQRQSDTHLSHVYRKRISENLASKKI